ncbi:uncharacterized protein zgc:113279 [Plectropomus leopardus]|uniref:uncharacterized protein zgc:113279 n=1 Tax=Plectropomus leopardus TaxID=160734 RepID=UPI001C4D2833|nr:uncharacterized protein zgc:113279 [Plectropomus leopardus]
MGGRCKRKEPRQGDETSDTGAGLSPLPRDTAAGLTESHTPVPGVTAQGAGGRRKGGRRPIYDDDKVYLGVRVKMPVRDLLRKIRTARGWEPQDMQGTHGKTDKGVQTRVKTRAGRQSAKKKRATKSLEELAIIVEVLEEDLRTGSMCRSSPQSFSSCNPLVSPGRSPTGSTGYNSDESDEMIPSPRSYVTCSPGTAEYQQTRSPPGFTYHTLQPSSFGHSGGEDEWFDPLNHDWSLNNSAFFWAQLHKEESRLREISDAVLLAPDAHGRTAFHKVACVGKRALATPSPKEWPHLTAWTSKTLME